MHLRLIGAEVRMKHTKINMLLTRYYPARGLDKCGWTQDAGRAGRPRVLFVQRARGPFCRRRAENIAGQPTGTDN